MHARILAALLAASLAWSATLAAQDPAQADPVAEAVRKLSDPSLDVRNAGYLALQRMGPKAIEAAPALLALLGDPNPDARSMASAMLAKIGPPVLGELRARLSHADATVRVGAAAAIAEMGSKAADAEPELIAALAAANQDPKVRELALFALGWIGSKRESAVQAVAPWLKDTAAEVRWAAARGLSRSGENGRSAWPALIATLQDADFTVRFTAAVALVETGSQEAACVPVLREALRMESSAPAGQPLLDLDSSRHPAKAYLRRSAAEGLGRIGAGAREAVPELVAALDDPQRDVRMSAMSALGRIGDAALAPVIDYLKGTSDPEKVMLVCGVLRTLGPGSMNAVLPLLEDPNASRRLSAIMAIGSFGKDAAAAIPPLEKAASDSDERVREMARRAVEHIRKD